MKKKSYNYQVHFCSVPDSAKDLVESFIDTIKKQEDHINTVIDCANKQEEENLKLRTIERDMSFEMDSFLYDDYTVLRATTTKPVGDDEDCKWSIPFKIINGVLFFSESYYKNKGWRTNFLKQGLATCNNMLYSDLNIDDLLDLWKQEIINNARTTDTQ